MRTSDKASSYVAVGKIASPYGIQGWIKVRSYTEITEDILSYTPWFLSDPHETWREVRLKQGKKHGQGLIVKLVGIHTPEEARLLSGKTIAIIRSQLPPLKKNSYYWSDLEGLTVINKEGKVLGQVIYLMATGSNDVLVVKGDKEFAVPYRVNSVILNVDLEKRNIQVDWEPI